jgi:endonuclease III
MKIQELVERLGGSFSNALGIKLAEGRERQVFKWFLASFLYGARIPESIATRTYREFERQDVLTPQKIQDTGWDGLVQILDAGGYVRYDFSTATKLPAVSGDLISCYGGRLTDVHAAAEDPRDLESRLQNIGKGIGPVTANIFLRELRGIWPTADPLLSDPVVLSARHLGLLDKRVTNREKMLERLKEQWEKAALRGATFVDFEAALVRLGLRYCRKEKHAACPMARWCPAAPRKEDSG